jgi:hypothetical protein
MVYLHLIKTILSNPVCPSDSKRALHYMGRMITTFLELIRNEVDEMSHRFQPTEFHWGHQLQQKIHEIRAFFMEVEDHVTQFDVWAEQVGPTRPDVNLEMETKFANIEIMWRVESEAFIFTNMMVLLEVFLSDFSAKADAGFQKSLSPEDQESAFRQLICDVMGSRLYDLRNYNREINFFLREMDSVFQKNRRSIAMLELSVL